MIKITELIRDNPNILEIFLKKNEYLLNRPDRYNENDKFIKNFNVYRPEVSKFLIDHGLEIKYPENKKFAVCLTHDVDYIYPPISHSVLSSLQCIKDLNLIHLRDQLFWRIKEKQYSPYRNFKDIMKLEDKYNAKSTFYFMATNEDIKRSRYNIEELECDLGYIVDNNCEVGLHGGYYSYNNINNIKKEKKRLEDVLGKDVIGYRNHYLRFSVPDTWELLSKAGFKYDTTFGYNDMVGFRNGMCHPFNPYNLIKDEIVNILEIPLIVMDSALFGHTKSLEHAWNVTKDIIDAVERNRGVLTLLWHTNILNCIFRKNWNMFYEKILEYCYNKNAYMTNAKNIWWLYEKMGQ